jgi:hypothetical protein
MDAIVEKPVVRTHIDELNDKITILVAQALPADHDYVARITKPDFLGNGETVTPMQAALILAHNAHNRKLNNASFSNLMGILMRGEWKKTHQGIAFYADGDLMDGQHRLGASVLTNIPLSPIMISGGYAKEDNDALDSGSKRTAADAASLAGVKDASLKCYIIESWMKYTHYLQYGTNVNLTNHQVKEKAVQHDAAAAQAIALGDAVLKNCAIAVMSRKEMASRAFEMMQGGWSPAFITALLTLVNQGTADYDGAPTVVLSEAYGRDKDEKSKFKLTSFQRQCMWHKAAGLYAHKSRVTKSAIAWKTGNPIPSNAPPADVDPTKLV